MRLDQILPLSAKGVACDTMFPVAVSLRIPNITIGYYFSKCSPYFLITKS